MADFSSQSVTTAPTYGLANSPTSQAFDIIPTVSYAQRVWSTGGTPGWCYYTGQINPTPDSAITTPNWVTSAIQYELLGPV